MRTAESNFQCFVAAPLAAKLSFLATIALKLTSVACIGRAFVSIGIYMVKRTFAMDQSCFVSW